MARVFDTLLGFWGYCLFAILVPVAALQALLFRDRGDRVAECYAFDLYVFGHILWLNLAAALLAVAPRSGAGLAVQAAQLAFVIFALRDFYPGRPLGTLARGLLLYAVYAASALAVGFATYGVRRALGGP
jgi:hypothetical protein